jgi:hypothetical protein
MAQLISMFISFLKAKPPGAMRSMIWFSVGSQFATNDLATKARSFQQRGRALNYQAAFSAHCCFQ